MRATFAALVLIGCSGGQDTDDTAEPAPEPEVFVDVGTACVYAQDWEGVYPGGPEDFQADQPLHVVAQITEAGSCDEIVDLSCIVEIEDDVVEIMAIAEIIPFQGTCQADAVVVMTECDTPALAAGTWQVQYGANTTTLEVPSVAPAPCVTGAR